MGIEIERKFLVTGDGWRAAAQRCAAVAAQFADAVDREARFPHEAFEALKRERLLSAMVPATWVPCQELSDCS